MLDFLQYKKNFLAATQGWDNEKWNNYSDNPFIVVAPVLQNYHVKNCRVVENRFKMLEFLPKNSVVAEVGTQYGEFAEKILATVKPQKLHLIDGDFEPLKFEIANGRKPLIKSAIDSGIVELHEGDSSTILDSFIEDYFDWIYIDADHAYEGVCKDIDRGYSKVKPDGLMVFNDYTNWSVCEIMPYGVARAVNEFCIANNWEIVFFALHSLGYHDIAIKKNSGEKDLRVQLQEVNSELQGAQLQVQQLMSELESAKQAIDFMENDKFWKLRSYWMNIKKIFS